MKKATVLSISLIALVILFMVGCTDSPTPGDAQPEAAGPTHLPAADNNQSEEEKISISIGYAPAEIFGEYNFFEEEHAGYETERIMFSTNVTVKDFQFIEIGFREGNADIQFYEAAALYMLDELSPERPLVVTWVEQGSVPHRGISFLDENDTTRYFYISKSGEDDSLLLIEFEQE